MCLYVNKTKREITESTYWYCLKTLNIDQFYIIFSKYNNLIIFLHLEYVIKMRPIEYF